ncbi:unnamed protein product [Pylaiella littoralis]
MDRPGDDSVLPPRPAAGGNHSNSPGSTGSVGFSSPPPPAAPLGEGGALQSPPPPHHQQQQHGGSSVYDLFRTAIGLTPRGLEADALSAGVTGAHAEEEEFWSAIEEGEEDSRSADHRRNAALQQQPQTSAPPRAAVPTVGTEGGSREESSEYQRVRAGNNSPLAAAAAAMAAESAGATQPDATPAVGGRDTHTGTVSSGTRRRQRQRSESDMRQRDPSGELDRQARDTSVDTAVEGTHAAMVAPGTARRRRLVGSNSAVESEPDSRIAGPRPYSTVTPQRLTRSNMFRPGNLGSFWRSNLINRSASVDNENGEGNDAGREGTRAVERAINGASAAAAAAAAGGRGRGRATATVGGVEVDGGTGGGSHTLDAGEREDGGGGGGGGGDGDSSNTSGQGGRILFYHKPTLANVPAGDVPDVVPVYLGCPRGNMALGLPLSQAWQGEENQDTTFNQNLSYTILSWPEDHVQDVLELWRLQVLFFTTIVFNILLSALLFFADNPDRTRVEGFARAGAFPGPFQQRSPADDPTGISSEEWHLASALLLSILGVVCVLARLRAGIALYLVLTVINAAVGLSHSPDALFASRYAVDVVLVAMGRSYLSSLTYTWVTASGGDGRRG